MKRTNDHADDPTKREKRSKERDSQMITADIQKEAKVDWILCELRSREG